MGTNKLKVLLLLSICIACNEAEKDLNLEIESWEVIQKVNDTELTLGFSLARDGQGDLWVATVGQGLLHYPSSNWYNSDNSDILNDTIWEITSDHTGNIWGSTARGIFGRKGNGFLSYTPDNSPLIENSTFAISFDSKGDLLIGNGNALEGGLFSLDDQGNWSILSPQNSLLPTSIIQDILVTNDGTIWTAHGSVLGKGGVWCRQINGQEKVFSVENSALVLNWMSLVKEDLEGIVWFGTDASIFLHEPILTGSLQAYDGTNLINHYPAASGFSSNRVLAMDFDTRNRAWISTGPSSPNFNLNSQLSIYDGKDWFVLSEQISGWPSMTVFDILIIDHTVWLASDIGLVRVNLTSD